MKTLISTAELVRDSETLADQDAAPAERVRCLEEQAADCT